MSTPERIEAAGRKKEEGNQLFKIGKYHRAAMKYEKVWLAVSFDRNENRGRIISISSSYSPRQLIMLAKMCLSQTMMRKLLNL